MAQVGRRRQTRPETIRRRLVETVLASESDPDAFVVRFASVTVFADGFESADASRWSALAP